MPQIVLNLPRGQVKLDANEVAQARDAAAAEAGRSSAARDLSLLLDRALQRRTPVALRRAELQTLIQVAARAGLDDLAGRLRPAAP